MPTPYTPTPAKTPRLTREISLRRGRWPALIRWGTLDPLKPGGWADRTVKGVDGDVGQLRAVTLTFPRGTGDHIPDARIFDVLKRVLEADFPLALGTWVLDYWPTVGWHAHGLATAQDAERLVALPGSHDLLVEPVYDLAGWVMYMTKAGKKKRVRDENHALYAEKMLSILAALPQRRRVNTETGELLELARRKLPSRVVLFLPDDETTPSLVRKVEPPTPHKPLHLPQGTSGADVQDPPPAQAEAIGRAPGCGCPRAEGPDAEVVCSPKTGRSELDTQARPQP